MADSYSTLTKTTTITTGTNDYVLETANLATAHRTPKQAVADGSLSDGDIVHYVCRDATITGDASFEEGTGVYTDATNTVARLAANVLDGSSGPGVLVVWPGSGQRDFYVMGTIAQKAARTDRANTFTQSQKIQKSSSPQLALALDASSGDETVIRDVSANEGQLRKEVASGISALAIQPLPEDGTSAAYLTVFRLTNTTGDRRVNIHQGDGSATVKAYLDAATGQWYKDSTPYDCFPSGTKLLFATAPPTGWTRVNEVTQRRTIWLARSGDTIGATGGADDIFDGSWDTGNHTLTVSQIPSHTHGPGFGTNFVEQSAGAGGLDLTGGAANYNLSTATGTTGGGASHDHDMATPYYRIACWATKD